MALTVAEIAAINALWNKLSNEAHHYVPSVELGTVLANIEAGTDVTIPDPLAINQIQAATEGGPLTVATSDGTPYMTLTEDDDNLGEPGFVGAAGSDLIFESGVGGTVALIAEDYSADIFVQKNSISIELANVAAIDMNSTGSRFQGVYDMLGNGGFPDGALARKYLAFGSITAGDIVVHNPSNPGHAKVCPTTAEPTTSLQILGIAQSTVTNGQDVIIVVFGTSPVASTIDSAGQNAGSLVVPSTLSAGLGVGLASAAKNTVGFSLGGNGDGTANVFVCPGFHASVPVAVVGTTPAIKTINYIAVPTDALVLANVLTTGNVQITLPPAASVVANGAMPPTCTVKATQLHATRTLTVIPAGADTIEGVTAGQTTNTLGVVTALSSATYRSDGVSKWYLIGSVGTVS